KDLMWYFGKPETHLAEEVRQLLADFFRARVSIRVQDSCNTLVVQTSNSILASFFRSLGKKAPCKHIPGWALQAPAEFREGLLSGLIDGDGHRRPDGICGLTTSSLSLAYGLRLLLWSQSKHAALVQRQQVKGRTIRG